MSTTRILVIDDNASDFALLRESLRMLPLERWTQDVEFCHSLGPLCNVRDYAQFAGVVLDLHLAGKSGVSVAGEIAHSTGQEVPILLSTGEEKGNLPWSVRGFCDDVAFKSDLDVANTDNAYLWTLRTFLRNCWRLRKARLTVPQPPT